MLDRKYWIEKPLPREKPLTRFDSYMWIEFLSFWSLHRRRSLCLWFTLSFRLYLLLWKWLSSGTNRPSERRDKLLSEAKPLYRVGQGQTEREEVTNPLLKEWKKVISVQVIEFSSTTRLHLSSSFLTVPIYLPCSMTEKGEWVNELAAFPCERLSERRNGK